MPTTSFEAIYGSILTQTCLISSPSDVRDRRQSAALSAEVPIRWNAIQTIIQYYYPEPSLLQEEYKVIVCKSWAEDASKMKANPAAVKPVIPVEHLMAFVLTLCCNNRSKSQH